MIRNVSLAAALVLLPACVSAQTATTAHSVTDGMPTTSGGSTLTTSATTVAPAAPGSTHVHTVATPRAPDRTTATGGNTNGGAN